MKPRPYFFPNYYYYYREKIGPRFRVRAEFSYPSSLDLRPNLCNQNFQTPSFRTPLRLMSETSALFFQVETPRLTRPRTKICTGKEGQLCQFPMKSMDHSLHSPTHSTTGNAPQRRPRPKNQNASLLTVQPTNTSPAQKHSKFPAPQPTKKATQSKP